MRTDFDIISNKWLRITSRKAKEELGKLLFRVVKIYRVIFFAGMHDKHLDPFWFAVSLNWPD